MACERQMTFCAGRVQVNSDPFTGGWMFKAKLSNPGDLDSLLDSGAYEKHCESGDH